MEFIRISNQVKEIKIPEGECKKIVEASTGRILWQKNLGPLTENSGHWSIVNYPTNKLGAANFVDYDVSSKEVMFLTKGTNTIDGVSYTNYWSFLFNGTTKKFSDFYRYYCNTGETEAEDSEDEDTETDTGENQDAEEDDLTNPHYSMYMGYPIANKITDIPVDIDPITKTIITPYNGKNYAAKFSEDEHLKKYGDDMFLKGLRRICWVPEKEMFLLFWGYGDNVDTVLLDTDGNVVNVVQNNNSLSTESAYSANRLCWAGDKGIFLSSYSISSDRGGGIYLSTNGLNWQRSFKTPDDMNSITSICYCSGAGTFLALCRGSSRKFRVYKSTDGESWVLAKEFENVQPYTYDKIAWSPKKKVACLVISDWVSGRTPRTLKTSYITRDFENWVEIPISPVVSLAGYSDYYRGALKWSDALNAFVWCIAGEGYFLKLTIDD